MNFQRETIFYQCCHVCFAMTIRLITIDLAENITKQILWTSIGKLLLLKDSFLLETIKYLILYNNPISQSE